MRLPILASFLLAAVLLAVPAADAQKAETPSVAAFRTVYSVLTHPRCMNCHTTVNWPTQGDGQVRHTFNVMRGPDGRGTAGMKCTTCHLATNQAAGNVPGAPDWHMAPLSMGWTGLTPAQLCKALKDPARNGGRTASRVIEHFKGDPLVLWAWTPGGRRSAPPVLHAKFVEAAETWVRLGAACPEG
jgi:hypothetical protein